MRELEGVDLWEVPAQVRVVTTNGVVRKDGACVMGRGCAEEAARRWPEVAYNLGSSIKKRGNICHIIYGNPLIVSMPVKHRFWEAADIDLIKDSAAQLVMMADENNWTSLALPRPGCGNGRLYWLRDVRPILLPILDDRFIICHNGKPTVLTQEKVQL